MTKRRRISEFFEDQDLPISRGREVSGTSRRQEPDPEVIAKAAAEKVLSLFSARTNSMLKECLDRLARLEEEVKALRSEIAKRDKLRSPPSKRSRSADALESYLDKNRFILGSESRSKLGISAGRLVDLATEIGAVIIDLGGDVAVLHREHLEEFDALLSTVRTPDPAEAAEKMGIYSKLFERLLKAGLVYYDASRGSWKRL